MKTDELIGLLGTSFEREPVGTPWMTRRLALAVAVGATAALFLALAFLGLRPGLTQARPLLFLALKVAFAAAVGGLALRYLVRAARPGGESRVHLGVVASPFLAVAALAGVSLSMTPPAHWHGQISGHTWLECLVSIPVIAIVPVRRGHVGCSTVRGADGSRAGRCLGRPLRGCRQRPRLFAALHGRHRSVRRRLVRGDDRHLHAGRGAPGTAPPSLVAVRFVTSSGLPDWFRWAA